MAKDEKVFIPPVLLRHYLITDSKLCTIDKLPNIVRAALKAGFKAVQLREKELSTIELYNLAKILREITSEANALFFINDRVDIHLAVGADGVHLGWKSMPVKKVRAMLGLDDWIGVSVHSVEEAKKAEQEGASYIIVGPIFETPSKAPYMKPLGLDILTKLKKEISIPFIAVGGIDESNTKSVFESGASGVAMIRCIMTAKDPNITAKNIIYLSK